MGQWASRLTKLVLWKLHNRTDLDWNTCDVNLLHHPGFQTTQYKTIEMTFDFNGLRHYCFKSQFPRATIINGHLPIQVRVCLLKDWQEHPSMDTLKIYKRNIGPCTFDGFTSEYATWSDAVNSVLLREFHIMVPEHCMVPIYMTTLTSDAGMLFVAVVFSKSPRGFGNTRGKFRMAKEVMDDREDARVSDELFTLFTSTMRVVWNEPVILSPKTAQDIYLINAPLQNSGLDDAIPLRVRDKEYEIAGNGDTPFTVSVLVLFKATIESEIEVLLQTRDIRPRGTVEIQGGHVALEDVDQKGERHKLTWRDGASREVQQETGLVVPPRMLMLIQDIDPHWEHIGGRLRVIGHRNYAVLYTGKRPEPVWSSENHEVLEDSYKWVGLKELHDDMKEDSEVTKRQGLGRSTGKYYAYSRDAVFYFYELQTP